MSSGSASPAVAAGAASGSVTVTRSPSRTIRFGFALASSTAERSSDRHLAVGDQLLDLRARVLGQHRDQKAIEPLTVELG